MKRASIFFDAVIFATLTGLALSCVVGCAGVHMDRVSRSLQLATHERSQPAETDDDAK